MEHISSQESTPAPTPAPTPAEIKETSEKKVVFDEPLVKQDQDQDQDQDQTQPTNKEEAEAEAETESHMDMMEMSVEEKENKVSEPTTDDKPKPIEMPITEVPVANQHMALQLVFAFLQLAHRRGAFSLEEGAKINECMQAFQVRTPPPVPSQPPHDETTPTPAPTPMQTETPTESPQTESQP
jgi:hypothetical protein